MGGVIGHHKPQFSLIGDTVNTTARYCAISDKGQISISDVVHEKVDFLLISNFLGKRNERCLIYSFLKIC